jgi:hypothetical protein
MFPSDILELWKNKIQTIKPRDLVGETLAPNSYDIPLEFRDRINQEYDQRVKKYYRLVGKEKQ